MGGLAGLRSPQLKYSLAFPFYVILSYYDYMWDPVLELTVSYFRSFLCRNSSFWCGARSVKRKRKRSTSCCMNQRLRSSLWDTIGNKHLFICIRTKPMNIYFFYFTAKSLSTLTFGSRRVWGWSGRCSPFSVYHIHLVQSEVFCHPYQVKRGLVLFNNISFY